MLDREGYTPFQQDPINLKSANYSLISYEPIPTALNKCIVKEHLPR